MTGSTPVHLVTGIDPATMDAATVALQFDLPSAVVAGYRIDSTSNQLVRTVSDITGRLESAVVDLDHACTSCAIREDVLPTLHRLDDLDRWGAIVAQLPAGASALQVCRVCALEAQDGPALRIAGVIAALDGARVLDDLTAENTLAEHGVPTFAGDDRGVGETLAGLIEYADAIRLLGDGDPAGADLVDALRRPTSVLATQWEDLPAEQLMRGIHAHRATEDWVAEVRLQPLPTTNTRHVWSLDLRSDRPMHPARLAEALDDLCIGSHRIRGCVWLPTRPDAACVLDGAAGHVRMGVHGRWPTPPVTRLTVVGLHEHDDPYRLVEAFEHCRLTDAELAEHGRRWSVTSDGLEPWLGDVHDVLQ